MRWEIDSSSSIAPSFSRKPAFEATLIGAIMTMIVVSRVVGAGDDVNNGEKSVGGGGRDKRMLDDETGVSSGIVRQHDEKIGCVMRNQSDTNHPDQTQPKKGNQRSFDRWRRKKKLKCLRRCR